MEQSCPYGHGSGGEEFIGIAAISNCREIRDSDRRVLVALHVLQTHPRGAPKDAGRRVRLLLVPIFNVVRKVFVYLRLAESFSSYFESIGKTDVGDCG